MEEKDKNNLPVPVKENSIKTFLKDSPNLAKIADSLRRAGIITGSAAVALAGITMSAIGALPVAIAGWGVFLAGTATVVRNTLNKTETSLLFTSKKRGDTITISQDPLNIAGAEKMRGYTNIEKGAMMGLQTLVGFSRYKQNFRNEPFELDENGQKIYAPKISTVTHSINLENLQHLQTLGYIKIDDMNENFPLETLDEKLLLSKGNFPRRSFLLTEKLGFGNFKGAKDAVKAMMSKDPKAKEDNSRIMKKVTFRLTDKPIDFEEIRRFSDPQYRKSLPEEQRKAAARIGMMSRVMKSQHLEIGQDSFGRDIIKYPSFIERSKIIRERNIKREEAEKSRDIRRTNSIIKNVQNKFYERLRNGVNKNVETRVSEKQEVKKQNNQEKEDSSKEAATNQTEKDR